MLKDIYILSRKDEFVGVTDWNKPCINAVGVNGRTVEELNAYYRELGRKGLFCLYVKGDRPSGEPILDAIVSLFFLPNYKYSDGRPVILVEGYTEKDSPPFLTQLKAKLATQGFDGLEVIGTAEMIKLPSNEADLGVEYRKSLTAASNFGKALVLEEGSDWAKTQAVLINEERALEREDPAGFVRIIRHVELERELATQRRLVAAMKGEIANLGTYVDFIRSGSQAAELQQYYNNEYEILPKWYKRFGHMIKVIMGKRNARSLYDDKVKKYKP